MRHQNTMYSEGVDPYQSRSDVSYNQSLRDVTRTGDTTTIVPNVKQLRKGRACMRCKLVKSVEQWEYGCENCSDLTETTTDDKIYHCTTSNFQGIVSVVNPKQSWVAKLLQIQQDCVPGVYAMKVIPSKENEDYEEDE